MIRPGRGNERMVALVGDILKGSGKARGNDLSFLLWCLCGRNPHSFFCNSWEGIRLFDKGSKAQRNKCALHTVRLREIWGVKEQMGEVVFFFISMKDSVYMYAVTGTLKALMMLLQVLCILFAPVDDDAEGASVLQVPRRLLDDHIPKNPGGWWSMCDLLFGAPLGIMIPQNMGYAPHNAEIDRLRAARCNSISLLISTFRSC